MSTVDNNPVYFIEEDQKITTTSYYRSKNQALLNKAIQPNWKHKHIIRIIIVAMLLVLAITCGALIQAFASSDEQITVVANGFTNLNDTIGLEKNAVTVDVVKGDTLWSIANQLKIN